MSGMDEFAKEMIQALQDYGKDVNANVEKVIKDVGKKAKKEIENHFTFTNRTGDYRKSIRFKVLKKNGIIDGAIYSTMPYRTHLLEHGHATPNGSRTRAFPHWKYGEEVAQTLPQRIEEALK